MKWSRVDWMMVATLAAALVVAGCFVWSLIEWAKEGLL